VRAQTQSLVIVSRPVKRPSASSPTRRPSGRASRYKGEAGRSDGQRKQEFGNFMRASHSLCLSSFLPDGKDGSMDGKLRLRSAHRWCGACDATASAAIAGPCRAAR
jgi:hypothetical protein